MPFFYFFYAFYHIFIKKKDIKRYKKLSNINVYTIYIYRYIKINKK